jgi:hypothetical protein
MLDENKKENRRKNLNTKKKKVNSKKRFREDDGSNRRGLGCFIDRKNLGC